jgi:peptide/nickel transport system substrate-binding protein
MLYNTLVEVDSNLQLQPSLASRWQISEDRTTYTFYLRNTVYFHDNEAFAQGKGRRMTAADVVYSLQRITDPHTASSGAWIFNDRLDTAHAFTALNDTTFVLRLRKPFQPILGILSMQYCSIVPHEVVEKYGRDFRRHPCGTGPFQLFVWEEGQSLVLHKNPHYWQQDSNGKRLPYLDAVQVSFFDNKATEFLQFRQGMLHFVNDMTPRSKMKYSPKKVCYAPRGRANCNCKNTVT